MRSTESPQEHWHNVEELARRNLKDRGKRSLTVEPCSHRVRVCFDGVCGVRCYEVDVLEPATAQSQEKLGPERDLGSACEPMS
jgi:hypothetical protein